MVLFVPQLETELRESGDEIGVSDLGVEFSS
jgi:hypothetical protein